MQEILNLSFITLVVNFTSESKKYKFLIYFFFLMSCDSWVIIYYYLCSIFYLSHMIVRSNILLSICPLNKSGHTRKGSLIYLNPGSYRNSNFHLTLLVKPVTFFPTAISLHSSQWKESIHSYSKKV